MPSLDRNPRIFLRDKSIPFLASEGRIFLPAGAKWTCPYCGESWAHMEGSGDPHKRPWHLISWPCIEHGKPYAQRGGSVLSYFFWFPDLFSFPSKEALLQSISRPLIEYETLIRCEQILKEYPQ